MRTLLSWGGAAIAALAITGCGTTKIVTVSSPSPKTPDKPASRSELTIGDTATLQGEQSGEHLEATLVAYKERVATGEDEGPEPGMKYVGVTLKLTNTGTVPYSDAPSNGATILTTTGSQGKTALIASGECSENFSTNVKIAPGESQEGCLPFEIPQESTAARLQWTPSSGFGEETAEWSLTQPNIPTRNTHNSGQVESALLEAAASNESSASGGFHDGDHLTNIHVSGEWAVATWPTEQPETILFRKTRGNWYVYDAGSSVGANDSAPPAAEKLLAQASGSSDIAHPGQRADGPAEESAQEAANAPQRALDKEAEEHTGEKLGSPSPRERTEAEAKHVQECASPIKPC